MGLISRIFLKIKTEMLWYTKGGVEYARSRGVKIGNDCRIYTRELGTEPYLIEIGNHVTVTKNVVLLTHDGSTWLFKDENGRRYSYEKLVIGNNVFIGIGSTIMPGVKIGNDVIIGAGSVVTKSIPDGSIVAGNPAKYLGEYYEYEKKVINSYVSSRDFKKDISLKENILSFVKGKPFKPELGR